MKECVMPTTATAVECVLCGTEVTVPAGSEPGDIVSCRGCGQELEVMELTPAIRLELAPEIEEDWGE
jgi:alpha-aminoadipate carrier protein LysW